MKRNISNGIFLVFSSQTIPQKFPPRARKIPEDTRIIQVELHADLSETSSFCVIDDIKLNIFYKKKWYLISLHQILSHCLLYLFLDINLPNVSM